MGFAGCPCCAKVVCAVPAANMDPRSDRSRKLERNAASATRSRRKKHRNALIEAALLSRLAEICSRSRDALTVSSATQAIEASEQEKHKYKVAENLKRGVPEARSDAQENDRQWVRGVFKGDGIRQSGVERVGSETSSESYEMGDRGLEENCEVIWHATDEPQCQPSILATEVGDEVGPFVGTWTLKL